MARSRPPATTRVTAPQPPFPLSAELWQAVVAELELSPQQERVARLLLLGYGAKEIADRLNLALSTIQTYLTRMFHRLKISKRMQFATHVMSLAVQIVQSQQVS